MISVELRAANLIVRNNLAMAVADDLGVFIRSCFDTKYASARTKTKALIGAIAGSVR